METPITETSIPLIELLQKQDDGDFLRAVAVAVLQLLMEHDVEGLVGAGRYERSDGQEYSAHHNSQRILVFFR